MMAAGRETPTLSAGWKLAGRVFWILIALNSLYTFVATQFILFGLFENPSERLAVGLAEWGIARELYFGYFFLAVTLYYVISFAVSLLIFLRRPEDRYALFVSIFLLAFGTANAYAPFPEQLTLQTTQGGFTHISLFINNLLSWPLLVAFFALYPDGQFVPRWVRWSALYVFFLALGWGIFPEQFSAPSGAFGIFLALSVLFGFGSSFYAQVWRYRHHAPPLQRQQIKWLVYALGVVFVVTIIRQVYVSVIQQLRAPTPAESLVIDVASMGATLCYGLIPIAVGFAILRYRLWDIDIIIRRTLTYGVLTAMLIGIYFGTVILLQYIFSVVTGVQQNEVVTVLSTLAIAALFVPLRNEIQRLIDRRFYRKKYDAQKVLNDFAETVRDETDLEKLTGRLIDVVQETMEPRSLSVWLKAEDKAEKRSG